VFIADAQLFFRAEHGVVVDAAQGAAFQLGLDAPFLVAVVERGAFEGQRGVELLAAQVAAADVGEQVRRAGDDGLRLGRAVVDRGQHQPVGVGVLLDAQDAAEHDPLAVPLQFRAG